MIELVASAIAILIALWSAVRSQRSAKRQIKLQERLLHLEEAEARSRSTVSQSAKLRAVLDLDTTSPALLEHSLVPSGQEEARQLGPGGSARYMLALTMRSPLRVQVEIGWADEASAAQSWRSNLSLT